MSNFPSFIFARAPVVAEKALRFGRHAVTGGGAGHDEAGRMLIEAQEQVGRGGWVRWLTKNFDLSERTARTYMQWARGHDKSGRGPAELPYTSLHEMSGGTERRREDRQSRQQQDFRRVLRDVARDDFVQERQMGAASRRLSCPAVSA